MACICNTSQDRKCPVHDGPQAGQFAPNHKLCYRCQGSGRERGVFHGRDPGDCRDCGGKGVVFKETPPSASGLPGTSNDQGENHG